ncbi:MAG: DNA repair protein RecN [Solirubrobacteraceae bacterium]
MLYELRVENLLLMERAELRLAAGLNILTGETGAGKTLLAHALDLLLGGKARAGIVREGAAEAYVEGVFSLPAALAHGQDERISADAQELVLARRVWPDGRTRAYVCGRAATLADLRQLGGAMLSFYGQHEHRKLMLAAAQLEALDAFCGEEQPARRRALATLWERVSGLSRRAEELLALAGARERELDLIEFELNEIEAVGPAEAEAHDLIAERDRLRHGETLRLAASAGADAIAPEEGVGASTLLASAAAELQRASAFDPAVASLSERMLALRYEADDLAAELRSYLSGIEAEPGRLEQVEERLSLFARLSRKHGGTIAEVLAHAARCRARRDQLEHADIAFERAEGELVSARCELERLAGELSAERHRAAPALAEAVSRRLGELAMSDARFEVDVRPRVEGCGPRGVDTVEFRIAANAGLPAGPLREVASGGELSRVMLALLSVAHGAGDGGETPGGLLVFDEIDAGIGGHTARAVGEHLRVLARGRQLLCITHLPQVAALAQRHFTIVKDAARSPARTTVTALDGDGVVAELVRMLGADERDRAARGHARELLRTA